MSTGDAVPEQFGDLITADHKVLCKECECGNNHRYAVVVQVLATQRVLQSHPCKTKTSHETERSLRKFLEPSDKNESHANLVKINLESLYVNTAQIGNERDC